MNPSTVAVRPNVTVDVVLRYLRALDELPDNTTAVFIVDRNGHYRGKLPFAKLLTQNPSESVSAVMDKEDAFMADTPAARSCQGV